MKDFMFYDKMRWWVYEYDAALTQQHCVRVTYREGLTIDPNSREPAFLPVTATAEGELCTCYLSLSTCTCCLLLFCSLA